MMYVFWWSGRGYITALIVFGTLVGFAVILQAGRPIIDDRPWFWGIGLLAAAALNWHYGTRANRKKIGTLHSSNIRGRLLYRARHRFMSLPMETFSVIIASAGLAMIVYGLFASP